MQHYYIIPEFIGLIPVSDRQLRSERKQLCLQLLAIKGEELAEAETEETLFAFSI